VGVWELLAIVHTLILCDLISLPEELIEPSLIVGQKIVDDAKDPSQTVIPSLYAVQGGSWCISLVTLVCLRVAVQDPAMGFELQDPKQKSMRMAGGARRAHSLESAPRRASYRHPENSPRSSGRLSQRFFSFGSSSSVAPAPGEDFFGDPTVGSRASTVGDNNIDKAEEYDSQLQKYKSWTGTEKRISLDSNIIYYPSHQRISQVTVTFRDESNPEQGAIAPPSRSIEARTVFINNHNYGLGELEFDQPGESLSELIFKAVSSTNAEQAKEAVPSIPPKAIDHMRMRDDSEERSETETKAESPTLSAATTLEQAYAMAIADLSVANLQGPQPPFPAVNVDLTRDQIEHMEKLQKQRQQYQPAWQIMMRRDHAEETDGEKEEKTHCPSQPMLFSANTSIIVPVRRSSVNGCNQLQSSSTDDSRFPVESVSDRIRFAPLPAPITRQNRTLPHEPEIPDQGSATVRSTSTSQARSPKPSLASLPLQYWRNRSNTGSEDPMNASSPSTPTNSSPFNLVNTFAKKMKQGTAALTTPPIPMLIPQIVLHPDEEDGEPARVLSETDIEYLSTMPPAPLRPLIRQWDDEDPGDDEEDYYDHDGNEGYDYDDYHHSVQDDYDEHDQNDGEFYAEEENEDQHQHYQQQLLLLTEVDDAVEPQVEAQEEFDEEAKRGADTEYDPYALDVPINLEIDLQGLEQGDIKIGYGYV